MVLLTRTSLGTGLVLGFVARDNFPLPTLGVKLREFAQELYSGRGFFVLRTIPIDDYSREELAIIFAGKPWLRTLKILLKILLIQLLAPLPGISAHVGSARGKQDGTGAVLAHIKDLTISHAHEKGGTGHTADKQVFHTDVGDLIALMALEIAQEGGTSRISSGARVYNELAATRPDLIHTLSESWPWKNFWGNPGYTMRPVLYYEDGHVIIQYSRRNFTGYGKQQRLSHIPPITEAQAEALDAVHFLAEKYSLGLNFQKGDIQYINSLGLLHARDAFKDSEQHTLVLLQAEQTCVTHFLFTHRRHLIRLWLRDDELAWSTPKPLQAIWQRLYSVPPEEQRFPLEPEIRRKPDGMTK